jgi:glycerophosphoryl diester phosphodiesterase
MKKLYLIFSLLIIFAGCRESDFKKQNNLDKIIEALHSTDDNIVLVTAHRAAHNVYPENSVAAIKHTIEIGADFIEIDTRHTKDGRIILMHDGKVDRTTDGTGKVENFTFAEIRALKLNTSGGDTVTRHIPTFREAMQAARGKIMVDIDIKSAPVGPLVKIIKELGMENQVVFFDSDFAVLDSVKLLDPALMVMPRARSAEKLQWMIDRYHPVIIHIDPSFYTKEVVDIIKKGKARVWINALGKADIQAGLGMTDSAYGSLVEGGANIIQTDRPAALLEYLVGKKLHW